MEGRDDTPPAPAVPEKTEIMKEQKIPVAREGVPFIFFAALASLVLAALDYDFLALLALVGTGFVLSFFRDPERFVPVEPDLVVSPADGKVIGVEEVIDDLFLHEKVYKISIFMNVFNVHVNRAPVAGEVESVQHVAGSFYAANTELGALENEYCSTLLVTPGNRRMAVVQVAGLLARRIVCWAENGDRLRRGERFGLIRFGSRVDLYLPLDAQLEVSVGQKVVAGDTVLGHLA